MQLGLVLDGFTRNEMLFDVAQGGSLRRATTTGQEVVRRGHNPDSFRTMINRKARISASDYGSANGNRTRILALKGRIETTISLIFMRFSVILAPRLHPRLEQGGMYDPTRC